VTILLEMNQKKLAVFIGLVLVTFQEVAIATQVVLLECGSGVPRGHPFIKTRVKTVHSRFSEPQLVQLRSPSSSAVNIPRGGSASFTPGDSKLQFYENLSGSVFSFSTILYGMACSVDPRGTAKILYGHQKTKPYHGKKKKFVEENEDDATVKFLMRIIGTITTGMGLTAGFSIASELKVLGSIAPKDSLQHAIAAGLIPRAFLALSYSLLKDSGVSNRIKVGKVGGKLIFAATFVETVLLIASVFSSASLPFLSPGTVIKAETVISCLSGVVLFFFPGLIFDTKSIDVITPHERMLTRLVAVYLLMSGPLNLALQMPSINSFPAVGVAALSYVVHQFLLQFASSDMKCAVAASKWSLSMILIAALVSAGTLWNYIAL